MLGSRRNDGERPLPVGREVLRGSLAQAHDSRAVGAAQADRVVFAHGSALLREEERLAVGGERHRLGKIEPGELPLLLLAGREDEQLPEEVIARDEPPAGGPGVVDRQPAGAVGGDPPLP